MNTPVKCRSAGILALLTCGSVASAGILANDPNALANWHGSSQLTLTGGTIDLDWAFYPSGPGSLDPVPGRFIYAYQFTSVSVGLKALGVTFALGSGMKSFGLAPGLGEPDGAIPVLTVAPEPTHVWIIPTEARMVFDPPLQPGAHTTVFWMSTVIPPGSEVFGLCELANGTGSAINGYWPSVAPSPAAAPIMLVLTAFATHRRRVGGTSAG